MPTLVKNGYRWAKMMANEFIFLAIGAVRGAYLRYRGTESQIASRLSKNRYNELAERKKVTTAKVFPSHFKDVFVLMLLGEVIDAMTMGAIIDL
jgi:magnesium-transporting ATPase (P-type)